MIDWEGRILARQEEREILEDQCDERCEYCIYSEYNPDAGFICRLTD